MIRVIAVGRIKEKPMQQCIQEYLKRLQPYCKTEIVEVDDIAAPQSNSPAQNEQVKQKEGERILAKLKKDETARSSWRISSSRFSVIKAVRSPLSSAARWASVRK